MTPTVITNSPAWIAAGWTILHFLWVGVVIGLAAAGWLALRSARPNVRYAFALVCLAALAVSPVVSVPQAVGYACDADRGAIRNG